MPTPILVGVVPPAASACLKGGRGGEIVFPLNVGVKGSSLDMLCRYDPTWGSEKFQQRLKCLRKVRFKQTLSSVQ